MTMAGTMCFRKISGWAESRLFLFSLRAILGGIFVCAGFVKMGNPAAFADSVASFRILPLFSVNAVALGLPIFEVAAGTMILLGWPRGAGALAILLLCAVFAVALAQALVRGLEVDCGCFGEGTASVGKAWLGLARAGAIGVAAFWIHRCEGR